MRAHVLLNLLKENVRLFFHNEFDKFNNTGAPMLDSIHHMTF